MPSSNPLPPQEANLFKKILKCYEMKQYKKSLQLVKEILKKFPDHGETLSMKGLILNYCNKKAEAYECAAKGLKNDLKSHVCWHVYGLLQRSDRKYDEAIKCYRNALKCDPDNLQILRDLSLLQIHIRDLEGYKDTRYQLLQLRPTQRASWIGYAMAYHLLANYELANNILEEFCKTQPKTIDYEQSEVLLYQNMLYKEAGMFENSIKHLEENEKYIVDKLNLFENKADSFLKQKKLDEAAKIYESLIERNPDNVIYYRKLEECLSLKSVEERVEFYSKYAEKYPRSDLPKRIPLEFLDGDEAKFGQQADSYLKRHLRKGVPPLFKEISSLYGDEKKLKRIETMVQGYVKNLEEIGRFDPKDEGDKEAPTTLLWAYYFLAQHLDYVGERRRALEYINKAIEHTPTLVELYMVKGKINKHDGDLYEAVKCLDEAQSLDTADRYINYKCSKYMLRANMIKQAEDIASKFTREATQPADYLREMQCMWFETESANAYRRLEKFGESLKKCHQVERHFQEIIEDQFDFHSYCMRKMTLCAYVDMLRLEDRIKSHEFFFKAAKTAIEVYLHLHDFPLPDSEIDANTDVANLTPSELKKLKNKQKKQQIKAQQEKEKQQQIEQKKKELNKQKAKEDGGEVETTNEEELQADKLERPENALEECSRFLKPLEEFASTYLETHVLAFEVYFRKNKIMLMLRAVKKLKGLTNKPSSTASLESVEAKFHYTLCKFLIKYKGLKETLNESIRTVIEKELTQLASNDSVEKLNETFLKSSPKSFAKLIEATKIMHDIDPEKNTKNAISLLTDIKPYSISLKLAEEVISLVEERKYFGKLDDELLKKFRADLRSILPHATFLKSKEEQENELLACIQGLSTTVPTTDLSDKMNAVTLKSND